MKVSSFFLFISTCFLTNVPSIGITQNFKGVIRYETASNLRPELDTLTWFFSDSIVLNIPTKGSDTITTESFFLWLLDEGKLFGYNEKINTWEEIVIDSKSKTKVNAFDSLGVEKNVLGFDCDQFLLKSSFTSQYGKMGAIHQLWLAKELKFEIPYPKFKRITEPLINNPAHRIVLYEEGMPDLANTDPMLQPLGKTPHSTLRAVSIQHQLPPLFFEIVRAFREGRAVRE